MNYQSLTKGLFLILVGICTFSCTKVNKKNPETNIPLISLADIAEKADTLFLSKIAKDITYIPLETTPDCVISQPVYIIRDNKIFVLDLSNEKMYIFSINGDFIRQIGSKGRGPQEYVGGRDIHVSAEGDIVHLLSTPMRTIYRYSLLGEKTGQTQIQYPSWKFAPLKNGNYFILTPFGYPHPDTAQFLFYVQDSNGKVLSKNNSTPNVPLGGKFDLGNFYETPQNTLVQHPFSDSVFMLSGEGAMIPYCVLEYGEYKTPKKLFNDKNEHRKVFPDYVNWLNLVETEKSLFISFYYQRVQQTGIYMFNEREEFRLKVGSGSMINDIDGGPDFWPRRSDGENMMYSLVQPINLIEANQNGEYENKKAISKKARNKFNSFIRNVKETDNPIIIVVNLN